MTDILTQNSIFDERIQENNAMLSDLFGQMKHYLSATTIDHTVNAFFTLRYALDLELILALRNTLGYLNASQVSDENRIREILFDAINDSIQHIKKYSAEEVETKLLEKARLSKETVLQIVSE